MLKCSTSLWSADLGQLAREIKKVEPHTDRFHLDVADGHYVKTLLFSPDLVRALRPHTRLPLEIHLMVSDPLAWVDPFIEAGADIIIFSLDPGRDAGELIRAVKAKGKMAGLCLGSHQPVDSLEGFWKELNVLNISGAPQGKEDPFASAAIERIRAARELIFEHHWKTEIEAEGGIDRSTAPLIKAAGADYIVAGTLMFKGNAKKTRQWLAEL